MELLCVPVGAGLETQQTQGQDKFQPWALFLFVPIESEASKELCW